MSSSSRKPLLAAIAIALTLTLLLGAMLVQIATAAESVAMTGGDPARSEVQPGPAPTGDLSVSVSNESAGGFPAAPIVSGSTLYRVGYTPGNAAAESGGPTIDAVDLASGQPLWTAPLPLGGNVNSGLALMNDSLFFVNSTHSETTGGADSLVAFSITTKTITWSVPVGLRGGAVSSSPVVKDGVVYWVDLDGTAHAVVADTGEVRWTSTAAKAAASPVDGNGNISGVYSVNQFAIGDGQIYLVNSDGTLAALKLGDGSLAWSFNVAQRYGVAPRVIEPHAYGGGVFLEIHANDSADAASNTEFTVIGTIAADGGTSGWRQFLRQNAVNAAIANGMAIVSLSRDGIDGQDVVAFDLKTGETTWQYTSKYIAAADAALAVTGDSVFVTGRGGFVFELSLADGSAKTRYESDAAESSFQAIFIAGGRIILPGFGSGLTILSEK